MSKEAETPQAQIMIRLIKIVINGLETMPDDHPHKYSMLLAYTEAFLHEIAQFEAHQQQPKLAQFQVSSTLKVTKREVEELLIKARAEYLEILKRLI